MPSHLIHRKVQSVSFTTSVWFRLLKPHQKDLVPLLGFEPRLPANLAENGIIRPACYHYTIEAKLVVSGQEFFSFHPASISWIWLHRAAPLNNASGQRCIWWAGKDLNLQLTRVLVGYSHTSYHSSTCPGSPTRTIACPLRAL